MLHDEIFLLAPFLDGEMLDVNKLSTGSRALFIDHMESGHMLKNTGLGSVLIPFPISCVSELYGVRYDCSMLDMIEGHKEKCKLTTVECQ